VPIFYQHSVLEAHGNERVQRVVITGIDEQGHPVPGGELSFDVDAVCLGYGFIGQSEIARALDPEYWPGNGANDAPAELDSVGRSRTTPELFVVGDARGLGGARIALAQGGLAGAEAARDLGHTYNTAGAGELQANRRLLHRHRRFQKGLWSVYAAPELRLSLADRDTIICRCESVTRGQVEDVVATGARAIGAIKRETRAGMGRCQGRYCAGLLAHIVPATPGQESHDEGYFAPRPPFKAQAIGDLATVYDPSVTFDRAAGAK
jgi:bacterioferritin-associated ferredoxin